MIYSMTGAGKASLSDQGRTITIFIKSVNSKQLDISSKLPPRYKERELELRSLIGDRLARGKVDLSVQMDEPAEASASLLRIDPETLRHYAKELRAYTSELALPEPTLETLLHLPGVLSSPEPESDELSESEYTLLKQTLLRALDELTAYRAQEGRMLAEVLRERIEGIQQYLKEVDIPEAERIPAIRQRLEEALGRLDSDAIDRGRLEQELVYYIDKLDVNEEKARLSHHLAYFLELLELPEGQQGKTLGFVAQEIGREINTLGSKSNNATMQQLVIKMKDELEQIKEQILNVL